MSARSKSRPLLERVLEAHGGLERWRSASQLEVELETGGLAFTSHWRPSFSGTALIATRTPAVQLIPYDRGSGTFGPQTVSIAGAGKRTRLREDPRTTIRRGRHRFIWDALDQLYFIGYALSNYLRAPFLFVEPGFAVEERAPIGEGEERREVLHVRFPPSQPTHCAEQTFYFDQRGFLRRLDYVAEPIGRWARAAHFCDEYESFAGLLIPTRRRVYPLTKTGVVRRWPTLIWINIHRVVPHVMEAPFRTSLLAPDTERAPAPASQPPGPPS